MTIISETAKLCLGAILFVIGLALALVGLIVHVLSESLRKAFCHLYGIKP
jgi:hypothetical protein